MSEFSRETLLNIIETDHVQCGEASALARMALAAMDSEPVAEVLSTSQGNDTSTIDRALPVGTQLYLHAQPEPVVHEEVASAIEELKRTLVDCNRYNYCSDAIARVESACRAAMLSGGKP